LNEENLGMQTLSYAQLLQTPSMVNIDLLLVVMETQIKLNFLSFDFEQMLQWQF
jgi:hypothetical protein